MRESAISAKNNSVNNMAKLHLSDFNIAGFTRKIMNAVANK
jgi:hypothetical protein